MLTVEYVKELAKKNNLRVFFFWPKFTEGDEVPTPVSIQVAFHKSSDAQLWLQLVTQPCEIPLETRGYRDSQLNIRPEFRQAFKTARGTPGCNIPPALPSDVF